ncbi:MAG: M56 family metallopeptidase [Akkermansiaceae bacterium]
MLVPSLIFSLLAASALWVTARRNPASDPRITVAALLLLLVLPLLSFAPKIAVTVAHSTDGSPISGTSTSSWILPAFWLLGCLFFAFRSLRDVRAMKQWRQQSLPLDQSSEFEETLAQLKVTRKVRLRLHPDLQSPVVAGLLRPTIYLPMSSQKWPPETLRMALLHELGHVQRRDLWMALIAQLTCILHWFNPAVWWMRRTFLTQCEYACDAHLLKSGADPKVYANALCDVASMASTPALSLAMAGHAPLRDRILRLSNKRRGSIILPGIVFLTATSAIAMSLIRFVPTTSESSPDVATPVPGMSEAELRFTANPFPAD